MTFIVTVFLSLLFWACLLLLAHTYAVYPVLLGVLAKRKKLPGDRFVSDLDLPEVAVLMAVYNEESVIEATLESILASDYPTGKIRVLIGSDGSPDRSDEIVNRFRREHSNLHLTVFGGRNGKIRIINQLAGEARARFENPESAVFVLCDANVVWSADLLRRLTSHFKRPDVGLVGAAVRDPIRQHAGIGDEEEAYIGQENLAKYREGVLWGKVMGAFGACYAMRSSLFSSVPANHIVDDFFLTFRCLEQGHKAIVDLEAVCYEAVSTEIKEEFRRKRRIAAGNFQNLNHFHRFLLPWNSDLATFFAFWSHKGLRWCGPFLLLGIFLSLLILPFLQSFYWLPLVGFLGTLLMGAGDIILSRRKNAIQVKLFRFARYFFSMNFALFLGFLDFMKGPRNSVWEPTKRAPGPGKETAAPEKKGRPAELETAVRK
ncbi:MAG: glycosyltransferase [Verrucomicrobiales bacterium]